MQYGRVSKQTTRKLLGLLKNLKKAIDRTGTTTVAGQMNFLRTIIRGGAPK